MQKLALNRYERYLSVQPADKVYANPQVQTAFNNLNDARHHENIAHYLKENPDALNRHEGMMDQFGKSDDAIRKNRGQNTGDVLGQPKSYMQMRKDTPVQTAPVQAAPVQAAAVKKTSPSNAAASNKFFQKAKSYLVKNKTKVGLGVLGAGALAGTIGYGLKKQMES